MISYIPYLSVKTGKITVKVIDNAVMSRTGIQ